MLEKAKKVVDFKKETTLHILIVMEHFFKEIFKLRLLKSDINSPTETVG